MLLRRQPDFPEQSLVVLASPKVKSAARLIGDLTFAMHLFWQQLTQSILTAYRVLAVRIC